MATVTSMFAINQPVDKAFAYVTSVENHKAWQSGIVDARVTPPGPIGVGSTCHYTSDVMGRHIEPQMQMPGFEQNNK